MKSITFILILATFLPLRAEPTNANEGSMKKQILYVGTFAIRGSQGIYGYAFDAKSGNLQPLGLMAKAVSPSFLAVNSENAVLYAVNEIENYNGQNTGAIQAYKIDPDSGKLTLLNQVSSQGAGPCFLSFDPQKKHLFVANYGGGSLAAFPLSSDGRIGGATSVVQHHGTGANPSRQNKPHPHSLGFTPDASVLLAADLGLDKLLIYRFDSVRGSLTPSQPPSVNVHESAGPRHFVFSHDGKFLYVVDEIDSTVTVFSTQSGRSKFQHVQTVSTLAPGYKGHSDAAEIRLSNDGRSLYVSNRGPDDIAVFTVDPVRGTLVPAGHFASGGKTPWNFEFSPDGRFVIVANQGSDNLTVLRNDASKSVLSPTGKTVDVGSPTSLVFYRVSH